MTAETRAYDVTIPHGTSITSPHRQQLAMPAARVVTRLRYQVPSGPRGNMGFQIGNGKVAVIPYNGAWIITTDDTDEFDLTYHVDSGTWWLIGYNTGTYTHTVYLIFTLTLVGAVSNTTGALLGTSEIVLAAFTTYTTGKPIAV